MSAEPHPSDAATVTTRSGAEIDLLDPDPDAIELTDIAHGLSNLCRCSGQTETFYSVALHSIYVHEELRATGEPTRVQLYGLLHDAAEAYVSDVSGPLKRHLDAYREVEDRIQCTVFEALDLPRPSDEEASRVHSADMRVREYELSELLPGFPDPDPGPAESYDLTADAHMEVAARYYERAESMLEEVATGDGGSE